MPWYRFQESVALTAKVDLYKLIDVAQKAFIAHTDWHLRHRDTSVRQLAVLIGAELAGLNFHQYLSLYSILAPTILFLFGGLGLILELAGVQSCGKAYRPSMENVLFMNKLLWAINPSGQINLPKEFSDSPEAPASEDKSIFVHRYRKDSAKVKTTDEFIEKYVEKNIFSLLHPSSSFFWSKVTIFFMSMIGITIGVIGSIVVLKN